MAYYPTYQPYPYQDQLNQLRTTNPMPMQGFQMPMNRPDPTGLNWVQGEAGAKSWFVNPGATVLLMDSEAQRFYLKSADGNGVPSMRTFEYTEIGAQPQQDTVKPDNFVTVDVFDKFKNEVMGKLEELSAPVEVSLSRKKKGEQADE
jgi:hypothetical protein